MNPAPAPDPARPSSELLVSRNASLFWTGLFVVPIIALMLWWFRALSPLSFLEAMYSPDLPLLARVPVLALGIAALVAMYISKQSSPRTESLEKSRTRRASLAAIAALVLLLIGAAVLGKAFLMNMLAPCAGLIVVAAAAALGLRLLDFPPFALSSERFASPLERLVLATALGLGLIALFMFFGGTVGLLSPWLWWTFIAALLAQGLSPLRRAGRKLLAAPPLHPLAMAALLVTGAWCLVHAAMIWSPPLEYDVLEYHLGAPAQFLRDGRVSFLQENIYAAFPLNGEMLYLLGLVLGTNKWLGLIAAHTILFSSWMLTLAGVYALTSRFTSKSTEASPAPALATLLFALTPLGSIMAADFYVEHIQALFHLAAVMAACAFLSDRREALRGRNGWLVLAGTLAGLCCGTKYPALLFTLAPLLILIPVHCAIGGSIYEALSAAMTLGVSALAMLAPWLLRNGIITRDPIFPLGTVMQRRAATPSGIPDHLDHFEVATRAGARSLDALAKSLTQLFPGFKSSWFTDAECGPQLLPFALAGIAGFFRRGAGFLLGVFLLDLFFWFFFTYRLNRFVYPLLAPLAVLAGLGIAQLWTIQPLRKAVVFVAALAVLCLGPIAMVFVYQYSRPSYISGAEDGISASQNYYSEHGSRNFMNGWSAVNALPAETNVLFIGEAQTFYLNRTPTYSVVFNESLLERVLNNVDNAETAAELLRASGITHIYINYAEWFRLDTSYAISRPDPQGPYVQAQWKPELRQELLELLKAGEFAEYGRVWPAGTHAAYLKLKPGAYAILEALIQSHTVVEKSSTDSENRRSCELRRLKSLR
jgi:hypothetical protein